MSQPIGWRILSSLIPCVESRPIYGVPVKGYQGKRCSLQAVPVLAVLANPKSFKIYSSYQGMPRRLRRRPT
ncbi:hypothetical protein BDZ89DRAFT_1076957 [Hymenopellis radicata]|nr:hypothetical protein BDZ89DRAFT_1076957 [Hymenopellis radicata]